MNSNNDWPTVSLGEHTTVKARLGWKGLKAEEYVEDGYVFLATPNLKGHQIDFHNVDYITKWRYDESPEIQLRLGDVLIVKDGSTLGICNYVRRLPCPATLNGSIAVVRTKESLDSEYLFHFVKGDDFQKLITLKKSGLGVPHLFQADLREFPISLPSISEQRKIAQILTTLDNVIEKTEAIIAKYQSIKQGMMHDLFTRGIDSSGSLRPPQQQAPELFKQSELGLIPKQWEAVKLFSVVESLDGKRIPIKQEDRDEIEGDVPYFGASGVIDYVDDWLFDEPLILLGEDGENILSRNLPLAFKITGKAWVNNHAHVMRPFKGNSIDYFTEYLESLDYRAMASGSAQPKITQAGLSKLFVKKPKPDEQETIADRLASISLVVETESKSLSKLLKRKSGLMQDLLTGRVRVNVDEANKATADA